MKYSVIFTTVITLALYSFIGNAGNVTGLTTYASDTILNASDLNNDNTQIKIAVDGNVSDISANAFNIENNADDIGTNIIDISANANDITINSNAITDNSLRLPRLKTLRLTETVTVDTARHYFTTGHLVATPPSDGYLYVEAKGKRNCSANLWTQASYGLYITTSTVPPTASTAFTHSEIFGFAFIIDSVSNGGDHNTRIMYPHPVTGGVTYHIWYGVDGSNVTSPFCSVANPRITATFFQSGL